MKEAWLLCFDEFQVTHISPFGEIMVGGWNLMKPMLLDKRCSCYPMMIPWTLQPYIIYIYININIMVTNSIKYYCWNLNKVGHDFTSQPHWNDDRIWNYFQMTASFRLVNSYNLSRRIWDHIIGLCNMKGMCVFFFFFTKSKLGFLFFFSDFRHGGLRRKNVFPYPYVKQHDLPSMTRKFHAKMSFFFRCGACGL